MELVVLNLKQAIDDLNEQTFSSVKKGLKELSTTIRMIPHMISECKQVGVDLSKIARMCEIFAHPMRLVYKIGKNMIINGVDIFTKIAKALISYEKAEFFDFGKFIGEAMDEVLLSVRPMTKSQKDTSAYEIMVGFLNGMSF